MCAVAVTLSVATAQQLPKLERTTDTAAVLALLTGEVDLYGDQFGSVQFQRGILSALQSKAITVRVLTSPASAPNMRPLKSLGAKVNTLPSRFTGSLVIVQGRTVIMPLKQGGYAVMRSPAQTAQMQGLMEQYWQASKPYLP